MPILVMSSKPQKGGSSKEQVVDPDDLFEIFNTSPKGSTSTDTAEGPAVKGHMHRKTRSLVGFDPMLDNVQQAKQPFRSDAVWGHENDNDVPGSQSSAHPLLSDSSKTSTKKSSNSNDRMSPTNVRRMTKSDCTSDLHDIATRLSIDKPRALTKEEERRYTLGDSTKSSIPKHDRKLLKKQSHHRKSQSLSDAMGLISTFASRRLSSTTPPATPETHGKALVKQSCSTATPPHSRPHTPTIHSPKLRQTMIGSSSNKSPKQRKSTTPPPIIPTLAKQSPTSFLKSATTMAPRSSEQDPSPHQMAIPSSQQLYGHAKLCALLDSYRAVDQNFDFDTLVDMDRLHLKSFCTLEQHHHSTTISGGGGGGLLTVEQKPIVQALLDCEDSLSVEGYVSKGLHDDEDDRLEVGIFSTQSCILVVYRGTNEQQLKPVSTGGRASNKCASSSVELDPENAVHVFPPFRDAYFELETDVYKLLDKLMEDDPFAEIVFCGHSFGGALATIGAARFATARPMLRFSCHVFACPKVGTHDFQQLVNTLPNLKVMRVEYGLDPHTILPADVGSTKYHHVGHSLVIHSSVGTNNGKVPNNPVEAYRFDHHKKPSSGGGNAFLTTIRKQPGIDAYVRALEPFAQKVLPWVRRFTNEDVGNGVRGKNNEKRLMV